MEEKTTFIYALKCPKTGMVRYIGKSNNPKARYYAHMRKDKTATYHKINWIQSLLKEGLKPELEIIEEVNMSLWKERERFYINKYRNLGNLTNCKDGGEGMSYKGNITSFKPGLTPWNKGTRKKKRCVVCNKHFEVSPSGNKKYKCCSMRCSSVYRSKNLNKGCFIKGQPSWNKGKKLSKNNSNSRPIVQIDINTGNIISKYPSAAEAERITGIGQDSITNNTCGRSKSAGGFKWKKIQ